MSYYQRSGSTVRVTNDRNVQITDHLPAGTYLIQCHPMTGFYLEVVDNFKVPERLYGDIQQSAARILNTFDDREASTGVLLDGEKGSGKTMLTRLLSLEAAKLGLPTLIVNSDFHGPDFNSFIQTINQPAVVLFDEFEKVYGAAEQQHLLSLLDGIFPTKKLFLFTVNEAHRVDGHIRNRPGRVFYRLSYTGLDEAFIREYCEDQLMNKAHTDGVVRVADLFYAFNFDMLKAMVEDMNRYSEPAAAVMQYLNAKPSTDERVIYDVKVFDGDDELEVDNDVYEGSPLTRPFFIVHLDYQKYGEHLAKKQKIRTRIDDDGDVIFAERFNNALRINSEADLRGVRDGSYTFESEGLKVVMLRRKATDVAWERFY